jgi:hypothetical protein
MAVKRFLSLGAGVQSSTLALMIAHGEIPLVDAAIFADTGAEPRAVYDWLGWLETKLPFPVHRVQQGDLMADVLRRKDDYNPIPAYRGRSIGRRQCTFQYKLRPIQRKARELAGLAPGERSDGVRVDMLIGISTDEAMRMKPSPLRWLRNVYPLVDHNMTRGHCLEWLTAHGYPQAPRSACVFCPYKSDAEWRDMVPAEFAAAVAVDQAIRLHGEALHRSGQPLESIDLTPSTQRDLFGADCLGMCGV